MTKKAKKVVVENSVNKPTPTQKQVSNVRKLKMLIKQNEQASVLFIFLRICIRNFQGKSSLKFRFAKRLYQGGFCKNP